MVAALVLAVGVLGTFTLVDGANRTLQENNGRVAASNLAREIAEQARGLDYDSITPADALGLIRPRIKPGSVTSTTTLPWQVERRNITFTIALNICTFDDPKDGIVTVATDKAPNACPTPDPVNTTVDSNPDDFRRVEMVITWPRNGGTATLTQTALVVNPSGGLGPRIVDIYVKPATTKQITSATATSVPMEVVTKTASTLHWTADDGDTGDLNASGAGTLWNFDWQIGTIGSGGNVDGSYTITAQAFDSRGVPGDVAVEAVLLNRRTPRQVQDFDAGRNNRHGGIVDMIWDPLTDRDIQEYRVYRVLNGIKGSTPVCVTTRTECTDTAPPGTSSGDLKYQVVGVDRIDLSEASTTANLREGSTPAEESVGNTGTRPKTPVLNAITTDPSTGLPVLTWTLPSGGDAPIFYRIYREDGTGVGGRYDRTFNATMTYSDPTPGSATTHTYRVTAVDADLDESLDSNAMTWVAP